MDQRPFSRDPEPSKPVIAQFSEGPAWITTAKEQQILLGAGFVIGFVTRQGIYGWRRPRFLSNDTDGITRANSVQ
jgi:hypothetical protein